MALSRQQLQVLARHGASARIAELQAEIDSIRGAFPGAGGAKRGRKPGRPAGRKRRRLSKAARKAISDAQKKRWAAVKAAK